MDLWMLDGLVGNCLIGGKWFDRWWWVGCLWLRVFEFGICCLCCLWLSLV